MDTLDIGGGFCDGSAMGDVAAAVNAALDLHFPVSSGVRVIAEPGRYAQNTISQLPWVSASRLLILYQIDQGNLLSLSLFSCSQACILG